MLNALSSSKSMYFSIFIVLFISTGCQKKEIQISDDPSLSESLFENSEYYINGEHFIDGVSQREEVIDFNIEGVEVINGVMEFVDQDAYIKTINILSEQNEESILSWHDKIGFESLFSETLRLESMTMEQAASEIRMGINSHFYRIDDQLGTVELKIHAPINSLVLNKNGILKIKDHVGAIGDGISIWTKPRNKTFLVEAMKSFNIKDRSKFIIYDDSGFNSSKDFAIQTHYGCAFQASQGNTTGLFTAPSEKRHIRIAWAFRSVLSPVGDTGLIDFDCFFVLNSTAYKGRRGTNRYKTNHYLSLDLDVVPNSILNPPPPQIYRGWVSNRKNTDQDNNRKSGDIINDLEQFRSVSEEFIFDNLMHLVRINPGELNSGQTGTSAFHRGMFGENLRISCDN